MTTALELEAAGRCVRVWEAESAAGVAPSLLLLFLYIQPSTPAHQPQIERSFPP